MAKAKRKLLILQCVGEARWRNDCFTVSAWIDGKKTALMFSTRTGAELRDGMRRASAAALQHVSLVEGA